MEQKHLTATLAILSIAAAVLFIATSLSKPSGVAQESGAAGNISAKSASVGVVSVADGSDKLAGAAAALGYVKSIKWNSSGFPQGATVDINLLKRSSDSPVSYDFVKKIASGYANTGEITWLYTKADMNDDYYVEVVCSTPQSFPNGCTVTASPMKVF